MGRLIDGIRSYLSGPWILRDPSVTHYFGRGPTASGATVDEWTALNYSAWWAATQIISNAVASLPFELFRRLPEGGKEVYRAHPLYRLLHDNFNSETTAVVARKTMQAHVMTWGNAYAEIERDTADRPINLWVLTPDRVRPDRDDNDQIIYRVYERRGVETVIPMRNMLHIPGLGFDGLMGYSVITKARESIGLGLATENYGAQFFGNGSVSSLVASHPSKLSPQAHANLKATMAEATTGLNRHRLLLLEEGMKVEKTSIPPEDAQFLETRRFQDLEVCRWFNLPPHKLAELERATFSNIEHQAIEFVQDTLTPWLKVWEAECNRKLIRPLEQTQQFTEHNADALLRGITLDRYNAWKLAIEWGWFNIDEVREKENMNPLPNGAGKIYLVPMNMTDRARLQELIDKEVAQAAPQPSFHPQLGAGTGGPPRSAEVSAAHRALIVDMLGQMIRKETQAARRASRKGAEGMRAWREDFYPKHLLQLCEKLEPAVRTHLVHVAATVGPQDETRRLAEAYIAQSHADLERVAATAPKEMENAIDRLMLRWEIQRPAEFADALMAGGVHADANAE